MIRFVRAMTLLFAAAPSAAQAPPSLAVVAAQELNVRAGPSPETAIVTKLLHGQRLLVRPGDGPWANVVVLVDGKMVEGWVNRSYITAAVPNGVAPAPAAPPNVLAQPPAISPGFSYPDPLTIDSADLDCDEDFDGGFSECTVEVYVSLSVPGIYAELLKDYVDVECEASVSFETADGFPISEQESESTSVYLSGGTGSETIEIDVDPFSMDPIIRAKIDDVECEIQ